MKKLLALLLAAMLALYGCAAMAEDDYDYEYDYEYEEDFMFEDGNPPVAPDISLPSNPSTGYQWTFTVDDPCLDVTDHGLRESDSGLLGAGGTHGFRLNGAEPGYAEVTFTYARAWEETPAQVLVLQVMVMDNLDVVIYGFRME